MRGSSVFEKKRIAAGIMGLMMLVIVLFSAFYTASEAHHECTGEDCPVCACIQQCENALRGISGAAAAQPSVMIPVLFILFAVTFIAAAESSDTLITRKVRLNN